MNVDGLGPLERRVMSALWARGPQTPREVVNLLNSESTRMLAYTTVMTVLVRLADKGYADRRREGRQFRYRPLVGETRVADVAGRRELDRLLSRYGVANVTRFAAELGTGGTELVGRLQALAGEEASHPAE
jgi:predicted transcriptional regulator